MKLHVPFKIPLIRKILFAASPSDKALITGIPPATAASYFKIQLFFSANSASSTPCFAKSALFAVTICFLFANAARTNSNAVPSAPPISSTTTSTSSASAKSSAFLVHCDSGILNPRSLLISRAARRVMVVSLTAPPSSLTTTQVPTVPTPAIPIFKESIFFSRDQAAEI